MKHEQTESSTDAIAGRVEEKLQQFEETIELTNRTTWDVLTEWIGLFAGEIVVTVAVYIQYVDAEAGIYGAMPDPCYWVMFAALALLLAHTASCAIGIYLVARRQASVADIYASIDVEPPEGES